MYGTFPNMASRARRILPAVLAVLAVLALSPNPALAQATNQITDVSPSSAAAGTANLLVTFTLDTDPPPAPPAGVMPTSVTIGTLGGRSTTHASQYIVTSVFDIPADETPGAKDCAVNFMTPSGPLTFSKIGGFTVTPPPNTPPAITSQPHSQTVFVGDPAAFSVTASGTLPLSYQWQKDSTDIAGATTETYTIASATGSDAGNYRCVVTNDYGAATSDAAVLTVDTSVQVVKASYPVVDTAQTRCYDAVAGITCPSSGQPFFGQDGQFQGYQPRFVKSADGLTVSDRVTGLTWQHTTDTNGDGTINSSDKMTWPQAQARPATLNAARYGGFSDWRLPTIMELYSLMDFRGVDPHVEGTDTSGLTPFIDRAYFDFAYGDAGAGERIIDSQYASSTLYIANSGMLFGVNFADGRIKGYGLTMPGGSAKTFFVQCVRGNATYGVNDLVDNGDRTVTDRATGLMWAKSDSGTAMNWQEALAWVQTNNAANHLGYGDWRLPNAKELQSLVDYTRSPDTTGSAAIAPVFNVTSFVGETCSTEYPWYWASTTHASSDGTGAAAVYVCFGRANGYMNGWIDIHGAGAQRSDPKSGSLGDFTYVPCGYYNSNSPQGDVIRIYNYVRLVRGGAGPLRASFTHSPAAPTERTPVTFTASASGGTSPYTHVWDLGGTPASGAVVTRTLPAGTHTIMLTVTDAAGLVTMATGNLTVGTSAPPPVADGKLAGVAATFSENESLPGWIDVTYDVAACSDQKAIIVYGSLGDFSAYRGCASSDAGGSGTASFDATFFGNVWFNVVWANGSTAGHPGHGFDGTTDVERTWAAAGFCDVSRDDPARSSCQDPAQLRRSPAQQLRALRDKRHRAELEP